MIKFSEVLFSGGSGGANLQVTETITGEIYPSFTIILHELNPYVRELGSNSICSNLTLEDLKNYRRYFDKAIEIIEARAK